MCMCIRENKSKTLEQRQKERRAQLGRRNQRSVPRRNDYGMTLDSQRDPQTGPKRELITKNTRRKSQDKHGLKEKLSHQGKHIVNNCVIMY